MSKVLAIVIALFTWPFSVVAWAQSERSVPEQLISAIRYEIRFERTFRGGGRLNHCISPEWDTLRPDHHRHTGWEYRSVPGLHSAIYLPNVDSQSKARSLAIAQLSFLTKLGFYREADGYVTTSAGRQRAKEFRLTPDGLLSMYPREVPAPCFLIGVRDLAEVVAIQPSSTSDSVGEPFAVLIRTRVLNVPPWAQSEEAQALFPELRELISPRTETITAWRYGDVWVTGVRQEAIRFLSSNQEALRAQTAQWSREYAFAPDPAAKLNEVKRGQITDRSGNSIESAACFPLRIVAGGDARSTRSRSVFAFYDIQPSMRPPTGTAHTVGQLNILASLAGAGAASIEPLEEGVAWGAPAKMGVSFRIAANAQKFVDMDCLPLGPVSVDSLASFLVGPNQVTLLIHARVKDVPRITREAARGIPALQTILNEGPVFQAFLLYRDPDGLFDKNMMWHVSGIKLTAPNMLFYDFPQNLSSLLPQTANAAGGAISAELRYRTPGAVTFGPE